MFETLFSKTFVILGSQLFTTWLATAVVIAWVRYLYRAGSVEVTATETWDGELDLELDWDTIRPYFFGLLVLNVAVFLLLFFKGTENLWLGLPLFTIWSILTGVELAFALISVNENLGSRILAITATITFIAALIGLYSGIDFAFLGIFLFGALALLLLANLVRLFVAIPSMSQRAMAFFGVIIFTGYLLFDFNRLAKLEEQEAANTWYMAMNLSIDIYLDIINLFLQLLEGLAD